MSKYTVELRYLIEMNFDIGLDKYPIFNENYRPILNKKIIDHYYFREIGLETAELFKIFLNNKMNEIMVYYNQLYKSELLDFNPLENVDKTEDYSGVFDGYNQVDGFSQRVIIKDDENRNKSVFSDTPQGFLLNGDINDNTWATSADQSKNEFDGKTNDDAETQTKDKTDNNTNYNKKIKGKSEGETYSEMLNKFRATFLNIDMMIIKDLSNLFMNVY